MFKTLNKVTLGLMAGTIVISGVGEPKIFSDSSAQAKTKTATKYKYKVVKKKVATYKTTTGLNVRLSPSKKGKHVLTLKKGQKVTYLNKKEGKWIKVKVGKHTGWISSKFIKKTYTVQKVVKKLPVTTNTKTPVKTPAKNPTNNGSNKVVDNDNNNSNQNTTITNNDGTKNNQNSSSTNNSISVVTNPNTSDTTKGSESTNVEDTKPSDNGTTKSGTDNQSTTDNTVTTGDEPTNVEDTKPTDNGTTKSGTDNQSTTDNTVTTGDEPTNVEDTKPSDNGTTKSGTDNQSTTDDTVTTGDESSNVEDTTADDKGNTNSETDNNDTNKDELEARSETTSFTTELSSAELKALAYQPIGEDTTENSVKYIGNGVVQVSATASNGKNLIAKILKGDEVKSYHIPSGKVVKLPLMFGEGEYTVRISETSDSLNQRTVTGTILVKDTFTVTFDDESLYTSKNMLIQGQDNAQINYLLEHQFADYKNWSDEKRIYEVYKYMTTNYVYNDDMNTTDGKISDFWYTPDYSYSINNNVVICYDAATITASLLRSMGIQTKVAEGYVDGYDERHAWNYVHLNGTWKLLDTTFDLSYLDSYGTRYYSTATNSANMFVKDETIYHPEMEY